MLLDSVAPEVNIISLTEAPMSLPTLARAVSMACSVSQPHACENGGFHTSQSYRAPYTIAPSAWSESLKWWSEIRLSLRRDLDKFIVMILLLSFAVAIIVLLLSSLGLLGSAILCLSFLCQISLVRTL
eukprot:scaffold15296_cov507-Ochromonas_danica.AAC.1